MAVLSFLQRRGFVERKLLGYVGGEADGCGMTECNVSKRFEGEV